MNVLTNREIYYNAPGDGKTFFQNAKERLDTLKQNQLFQTGAAAYGGYLQQKYQGGGYQPLPGDGTGSASNQGATVIVTDGSDKPKTMSTGLKIGIGVGVAAIIGIVIFVVIKNKNKGKK